MSLNLFKRQLAKCGQTVTVKRRALSASGYDSSQPNVGFTDIDTPKMIVRTIETVRGGSKLFSGVQIVKDATHIFCGLYDAVLTVVERDNYYIFLGTKAYRVLAVTNINERDKVLAIQTTERGVSLKEATKA